MSMTVIEENGNICNDGVLVPSLGNEIGMYIHRTPGKSLETVGNSFGIFHTALQACGLSPYKSRTIFLLSQQQCNAVLLHMKYFC